MTTPATRRYAPEAAGDPTTRTDAAKVCPSVYVSSNPSGRRSLLRLEGSNGLRTLNAQTRSTGDTTRFKASIVAARYGAVDVSVMKHTAHLLRNEGTSFGHDHPVHRLVVVLEGSGSVRVGRRTLHLSPGTGFMQPGNIPVSYETHGTVARLHLDLAADHRVFAAHLGDAPLAHWATPSPALQGLAAFGQAVLRLDDARTTWPERTEVRRALESLVLTTIASAPPMAGSDAVDQSARGLTLEYIRLHHGDPQITPAAIARGLGVSVRTLQRAFEHDLGIAQWIARFRLEHALTLLRDRRFACLTMPEIAERAGYGSAVCMRRAVIAETGQGPAEYRRSSATEVAHPPATVARGSRRSGAAGYTEMAG